MKKIFNLVFFIMLLLITTPSYAACEHGFYGKGDGTEANPYLVSNIEGFKHVDTHSSEYRHYLQTQNLYMNQQSSASEITLNGIYDGNENKLILTQYIGRKIWWQITQKSILKDLTIEGASHVGVANSNNGLMSGIVNKSSVSSRWGNQQSGLADYNSGVIDNCRNEGDVTGDASICDYVGGLVASNSGVIKNSSFTGKLYIYGHQGMDYPIGFAGGIVAVNGRFGGVAEISNCYVENIEIMKKAYFTEFFGGIVGGQYSGSVKNCYALSVVKVDTANKRSDDVPAIASRINGSGWNTNNYYRDNPNGSWDVYIRKDGNDTFVTKRDKNNTGTTKQTETEMRSAELVKKLNNTQIPPIWRQGSMPYPYPIFIGKITIEMITTSTPFVGDNTQATLLIGNISNNIDILEIYDLKTNRTFYKGVPKGEITFTLPTGNTNIGLKAYDNNNTLLTTLNPYIVINKEEILNKILEEMNLSTGLDKMIILDGNNRVFDNNTTNQAIVNQIKAKGQGIYFIYDTISPVLNPLVER